MMKPILAACFLVGSAVAFSGTATADPTDTIRLFSGGAYEYYGNDPCNGLADDTCVCQSHTLTCSPGETCRNYAAGQCIYG